MSLLLHCDSLLRPAQLCVISRPLLRLHIHLVHLRLFPYRHQSARCLQYLFRQKCYCYLKTRCNQYQKMISNINSRQRHTLQWQYSATARTQQAETKAKFAPQGAEWKRNQSKIRRVSWKEHMKREQDLIYFSNHLLIGSRRNSWWWYSKKFSNTRITESAHLNKWKQIVRNPINQCTL